MPRLLLVLDLNDTLATKQWSSDFRRVTWTPHPDLERLWSVVASTDAVDVLLWSGAWRATVDAFVDQCVPDSMRARLLGAWCNTDAIEDTERPSFKATRDGAMRNVAVLKDLELVWRRFPQYNERNTIIVDDSVDKTRRQAANAWIVSTSRPISAIDEIIALVRCFGACANDADVRHFLSRVRAMLPPSGYH
jgi:hypothetical protein